MDTWVTKKKGKYVGRAWSVMTCRNKENHKPHTWESVFTLYGPYCCPGVPAKKVVKS